MLDFIGDIHGHADELISLLKKLGYTTKNGTYSHPESKALFVGDYIDRGPKIKETLDIVRRMVDSGNAIALMGNHEYNALCFHYQESEGGHLRKHSIKNIIQHYQTLEQFQNRQQEYEEYLDWFITLPLFYEADAFRAVHACWDAESISYLRNTLPNDRQTYDLLTQTVNKGSALYRAIDITLKGKEISLPAGSYFTDKDGTDRTDIRIKWWEDPVASTSTYRSISVEPLDNLPETPVVMDGTAFYNDKKPVFFGHYWLKGSPIIYRGNICCLDYSVARGGKLVAYRFDGEEQLDNANLVFV